MIPRAEERGNLLMSGVPNKNRKAVCQDRWPLIILG